MERMAEEMTSIAAIAGSTPGRLLVSDEREEIGQSSRHSPDSRPARQRLADNLRPIPRITAKMRGRLKLPIPPEKGLARAAENALAIEDGLGAVAEWETEHGALAAAELLAADAALNRASEMAR